MSIEEREGRVSRSIRVTTVVNDRLTAVCDHMGVTVSSYIIACVGRAVSEDEKNFNLSKTNESVQAGMGSMIELMNNLPSLSGALRDLPKEDLPREETQLPILPDTKDS